MTRKPTAKSMRAITRPRGGGGLEFLNSTNYVGLFHFPSAILYLFHTLPQAKYLFRFLKKTIDEYFMAAIFNFACSDVRHNDVKNVLMCLTTLLDTETCALVKKSNRPIDLSQILGNI